MDSQSLLAVGALAGAATAIIALVVAIGRPIRRLWRRVDAFLSDWNGEPARPGRESIPSMPERMQSVETRLAKVEKQVTPNGGNTSSLGDRVARIGQRLGTEPDQ